MAKSVEYNLEEYKSANDGMKELRNSILTNKTTMKNNLEQLRNDWNMASSVAFFDSLDTDWEDVIRNCIDIMDEITGMLDEAYEEYEKIEIYATNYFKI